MGVKDKLPGLKGDGVEGEEKLLTLGSDIDPEACEELGGYIDEQGQCKVRIFKDPDKPQRTVVPINKVRRKSSSSRRRKTRSE